MPSLFHESVVDLLEDTLTCEIARATRRLRTRAGRKMAEELGKIYKGRSAAVDIPSYSGIRKQNRRQRHPDASWYHPSQPQMPTCLLEVSYSQPRRSLQCVARDYIQGAKDAIRCVIGLDTPYPMRKVRSRSSLATMLIWRTSAYRCHSLSLRKRNSPSDCVKFYPRDFLPSDILPKGSNSSALFEIQLASVDLLVRDAEARATAAELAPNPISPPSTPKVFRKKNMPSSVDGMCQPCVYATPVKARGSAHIAPITRTLTHKHDPSPLDAVMADAGLWTPPNSQTRSDSTSCGTLAPCNNDGSPSRRSPRIRRFKEML